MQDSLTQSDIEAWLKPFGFESIFGSDERGYNALHIACSNGNLEIVQWLIDHGAPVSEMTQCTDGLTPFMCAVRKNHLTVSQWLYARFSGENALNPPIYAARNKKGTTPLMYAAESASLELVQWLLQIGANVKDTNTKGSNLVMWATANPNIEILKMLTAIDRTQISISNREGMTALAFAVKENRVDMVDFLRDQNVLMTPCNVSGMTPLLLSAQGGHLEVAKQLIRYGCSFKEVNNRGANVLLLAAQFGHVHFMEWVTTEGKVSIFSTATNGCTALMYAANGGRQEAMEWLISKGCDVMECSPIGTTPIMFAAMDGHTSLIKWLHETHGCKLTDSNQRGYSVLQCAVDSNSVETVRYMVESGTPVTPNPITRQTMTMFAAFQDCLEVLQYLVSEKLEDPELILATGLTAFSLAISKGNIRIMDWMYANVPNISLNASIRNTGIRYTIPPLHVAVRSSNIASAQWLVANGADVNAACPVVGRRPLEYVAASGAAQMFWWLIKQGASLSATGSLHKPIYYSLLRSPSFSLRKFVIDNLGPFSSRLMSYHLSAENGDQYDYDSDGSDEDIDEEEDEEDEEDDDGNDNHDGGDESDGEDSEEE